MTNNSDYTLYSGAHKGAEAEFGSQAEQHGINEVNYSFEGHQMERERGVEVLSSNDLQKGEISMEIISERMGRKYTRADKVKVVIQSIYHMVHNGFQVFAVGWIQEDNTVKGGTGWAVELAKLFNRPLHVFDQDKNAWFTWEENTWKQDTPTIQHKTFCGTGTRSLSAEGKQAIKALYDRSFS